MPASRDHASEVAYFLFEPLTLGSKHRELRSCAFQPLLKLLFELRESVSHNVLVEHFALKSFKHFAFEVVLSDVQAVLANSPSVLLWTAIPHPSRLPTARNDNHL
jgi:hypothetical protein